MPSTTAGRVPVVYGSVLLNPAGRFAERAVLSSLGWAPGTPIDIRLVLPGVLVVVEAGGGEYAIARNGQLPIPSPVRRRAALRIGHRVLLAAYPHENRLIVVGQIALDTLLTDVRSLIDGGEQQ
ncbi:hypothetical protein [Nocardia sp. XZ_19_369]|uniref:hypothetical protein n=1 Tax=Nocardia sp. XZ_19_369 TaxID=2769487 RepID=UPI00188F64A8|nr:hypothetical protein [Nocardia sp. XZ_19_369]